MQLKVKRIHPNAILPTKAYNSAGYDLYCTENITLDSRKIVQVRTGICLEIPEGHVGLIWDKSSKGLEGVKVYGGVIDADYRGEIIVLLGINNKFDYGTIYNILAGTKVAQILIQKVEHLEVVDVDDLQSTVRGEKGFGSSGHTKEEISCETIDYTLICGPLYNDMPNSNDKVEETNEIILDDIDFPEQPSADYDNLFPTKITDDDSDDYKIDYDTN